MPEVIFTDTELGDIHIRRHPWAKQISIKLSVKNQIIATAPKRTPLVVVKQVVRQQRSHIRAMLDSAEQSPTYQHGQTIGHSHHLSIIENSDPRPATHTKNRHIIATAPTGTSTDATVQDMIRASVIKALKKEAVAYLTRRLALLAERHGYSYEKVRFTHSGGRWGSCSNSGTVSLNIALMKLPLELIDYVLIHELCHTKEMNHSESFWRLVAAAEPQYRQHRKTLKSYTPHL